MIKVQGSTLCPWYGAIPIYPQYVVWPAAIPTPYALLCEAEFSQLWFLVSLSYPNSTDSLAVKNEHNKIQADTSWFMDKRFVWALLWNKLFLCVLKIRTVFSPVLFERVCILRLNVCVFDPSAAKLSQRPDAPHWQNATVTGTSYNTVWRADRVVYACTYRHNQ